MFNICALLKNMTTAWTDQPIWKSDNKLMLWNLVGKKILILVSSTYHCCTNKVKTVILFNLMKTANWQFLLREQRLHWCDWACCALYFEFKRAFEIVIKILSMPTVGTQQGQEQLDLFQHPSSQQAILCMLLASPMLQSLQLERGMAKYLARKSLSSLCVSLTFPLSISHAHLSRILCLSCESTCWENLYELLGLPAMLRLLKNLPV